jgi:hypothetical protein
MGPAELITNGLASVVLAGLMIVPFLNILVGSIVGAGLAGLPGLLMGATFSAAITAAWVAIPRSGRGALRLRVAEVTTEVPARPSAELLDWRPWRRELKRRRVAWSDAVRRAAA